MKLDRKCENCVYWEDDLNTGGMAGRCHRFPPQIVKVISDETTEIEHLFPQTTCDAWCGEFKPREEGGT